MGKRILVFNIFYYAIVLFLIKQGRDDPSASLGYGIFIVFFWGIAAVVLAVFLSTRLIIPRSKLDHFGVFTSTPIISLVIISAIATLQESVGSTLFFQNGSNYYKEVTIDYKGSVNAKRIEYYKSLYGRGASVDVWKKDSTWLYFSETGDTLKKEVYKDGIKVE
jgi:hypothetical protein